MKKVCVYLISLLFFLQTSLLAYSPDPKTFVIELVNDAISKLSDKNLNNEQKAVFIEKDPSAVRVIRRNCEILDFAEDTDILTTDACQITSWRFDIADIIFCDAPYNSGLSLPALDALNKAGGIGLDTIIAVETRRKEPELSGGDFTLLDSRHYGIARLSFYKLS